MKQNSLFVFALALFAVFAIGLVILSAIDRGTLPVLLLGLIAVCVVGAALAAFAIRQYERWTNTRIKAIELNNNFMLAMAKEGYLPKGSKYESIKQIAAPQVQKQQRVFDFNPNDIHTAAVNYILFSRNLLGDSGNRLASGPECASANIANYSARSWERIVSHLSNAYGIVRQSGPIANGGGVYVPDDIGTVKALYDKVLLNSAVEALPKAAR